MSKNFLKRYRLILETLGPVHIGSGLKINKKEWLLDNKLESGYIIDEKKFFSYLINNKLLDEYQQFMLNDNRGLFDWMKEHRIYPKDIDKIAKYRLDCSNVILDNQLRDVQLFIKDGYGKPYVPGSSIKGALSDALMSDVLNNKDIEFKTNIIRQIKGSIVNRDNRYRDLKRIGNKLASKQLFEEKRDDKIVNSMNGIRISDSEQLSFDNLALFQKVDVNTYYDKENNLPIYRESIIPGTVIESILTIDTTLTNVSIEDIRAGINSNLTVYNEEFLSKFAEEERYFKDVLYIGGGVGFHSKTITGTVLRKEKDKVNITSEIIGSRAKKDKHYLDKKAGVSPRVVKLTEFDAKLIQFGPCKVSFEEF